MAPSARLDPSHIAGSRVVIAPTIWRALNSLEGELSTLVGTALIGAAPNFGSGQYSLTEKSVRERNGGQKIVNI
jgi:hypothetical protein